MINLQAKRIRVSIMPKKSKGSVALLCLPLRFAGIFKILASFAEFRTWLECLVSRKCCDKLHDKNYITITIDYSAPVLITLSLMPNSEMKPSQNTL